MKLPGSTMVLDRWITGLLFLLLTGLLQSVVRCAAATTTDVCGEDVQASKNRCVAGYHQMLSQASADNFYTGMDVEEVRSVCQSLIRAVQCTHNLKQNCPDTEHTDIEITLADLVPALKLCTYPNLYEVYARNQFCYMRTYVYSEHCYLEFQANTEGLVSDIYIGDPQAVTSMCSHLDELISCISTNVQVNCNREAADLIAVLVNPSITLSESCHNDTSSTTTVQPLPSTPEPMVNDDTHGAQESGYTSSSSTSSVTFLRSTSSFSALLFFTSWLTSLLLLYR